MDHVAEMLKNKPPHHGVTHLYRLRYRFDFHGKPSVFGAWNRPEEDQMKGVWRLNKEGLARVSIEGEKHQYFTIHTLLEVDGHDYVSMRWVNTVPLGGWSQGTWTREGNVTGLTILTRTKAATVFVDGRGDLRDLNDYEKKFKLKEHSV